LDIFNEFPVYELIIHPRTREDYYKNIPNLVAFEKGYNRSKANVCYNGDIFSKENYHSIISRFPELGSMMFGRGILRYPGLIRFIKDRTVMKKHELLEFHNMIYESYRQHLYGDKTVLFKMKELWSYMIHSFEYDSMIEKRIKKAQKLIEYDDIIRELFSGYGLIL
jgi:tRNA-dihydrouridine synthase